MNQGHERRNFEDASSVADANLNESPISERDPATRSSATVNRQSPLADGESTAITAAASKLQAKLTVGGTEDPAEREAGALAAEVAPRIRRNDHTSGSPEVNRTPAQRIRRRTWSNEKNAIRRAKVSLPTIPEQNEEDDAQVVMLQDQLNGGVLTPEQFKDLDASLKADLLNAMTPEQFKDLDAPLKADLLNVLSPEQFKDLDAPLKAALSEAQGGVPDQ